MSIMKNDLRIQKTETAIENAFLELIEEKGFSNIQLMEIAKRANVNRNTIYIRYGAKEDIIDAILNKSYKRIYNSLDIDKLVKTKYIKREIEKMFNALFNAIYSEIELYRIVLTDINLSGYIEKILKTVRKLICNGLKDTKDNEIIINYMLNGVYGIIRLWIIYDNGTIEENSKVLSSLVYSNIRKLSFRWKLWKILKIQFILENT